MRLIVKLGSSSSPAWVASCASANSPISAKAPASEKWARGNCGYLRCTGGVNIRKYRLSTDRPPEWPEGVYGVSMKGIGLLGIHEKSGKLYWDGKEVVI